MSDTNPYEILGVTEDSSFDEIQEARNRLVSEHKADGKQVEAIEAAYDAILMDRLRLRQEGKIKVPDRIRFPERSVAPPPDYTPPPAPKSPDWLQQFIDTPSRADVLWPAGLFLGTSLLSLAVASPALPLALGVGFSLYFLTRKERKFGRALLLTLVGLIVGISLGLWAANLLQVPLPDLYRHRETFAAILTFLILWLTSSFLR